MRCEQGMRGSAAVASAIIKKCCRDEQQAGEDVHWQHHAEFKPLFFETPLRCTVDAGKRRACVIIFWRAVMKASVLYRIAAVLLLLFAAGHTLGFWQVNPQWGVDSLVQSMKSIHFNANGSERTYWDFYIGFGLFVTILMLFAALIAWELGSLPARTLASMRVSRWGFALCFAVVTYLSQRYFFLMPFVFSVVIFVCLIAAAWLSNAFVADDDGNVGVRDRGTKEK